MRGKVNGMHTFKCTGFGVPSCKRRWKGQAGWDFIMIAGNGYWFCPDCRKRLAEEASGPGLPKPCQMKTDNFLGVDLHPSD
jgi:hypothetical protein